MLARSPVSRGRTQTAHMTVELNSERHSVAKLVAETVHGEESIRENRNFRPSGGEPSQIDEFLTHK